METEPRNFSGSYPLAGERLGPAWRMAWQMLSTEKWINAGDIAAVVSEACDLQKITVKGLLRSAARAGILDQKIMPPENSDRVRPAAHYRVRKG
jgi:hypothetical protein